MDHAQFRPDPLSALTINSLTPVAANTIEAKGAQFAAQQGPFIVENDRLVARPNPEHYTQIQVLDLLLFRRVAFGGFDSYSLPASA